LESPGFSHGEEVKNPVKAQEGFSPYTLRAYGVHFKAFRLDLEDCPIEDVTLQRLRDHASSYLHLKPTSQASKVRALKSLFKWLHEEEYLVRNPALKFKEPKMPQRVPKALTVDEIEDLRDACTSLLEHALIEFFFATGARVGEAHRLNRNALDWTRKAATVLGKGNKEREVYFGSRAAIWMRRYLDSRHDHDVALFVTDRNPHRVSIHHIQRIFKRVATRRGLEDRVTPHVLRHTLATVLLNQGAPLAAVQSILGHQKPETTQLYAHLSGSVRQQAYQRYFVQ
jgi:integrase/recombinase XerD